MYAYKELERLEEQEKICRDVLADLYNKAYDFMNKLDESNDNKLDELEVYSTLHKLKKKHGLDEDFD